MIKSLNGIVKVVRCTYNLKQPANQIHSELPQNDVVDTSTYRQTSIDCVPLDHERKPRTMAYVKIQQLKALRQLTV